MKIGILGGSFNPVHNEHLFLADFTFEILRLDKILFIPTYNALHKDNSFLASYFDRIEMLKLALLNRKNYSVSNVEYELNKNSYTYFTLKALKERYPNDDLYFIMGKDSYLNFCSWYQWEKLLELAKFVVLEREGCPQILNNVLETHPLNKDVFIKYNISGKLLSSSEIRNKVKNKEKITGLVPMLVEDYIEKHKLYR